MEIIGKIRLIQDEQQITDSFKKREVVITTEEQYPQNILVEFHQDKTDLLNSFQIGEVVKISINIRGREWVNPQGETKYFNSIQGWKIEKQEPIYAPTPPIQNTNTYDDENDDIPF